MSKELGVHLKKRAFLEDESGESDSSEVHPHPGLRQHVHYDTPVLGHSTWRECGGREGGREGRKGWCNCTLKSLKGSRECGWWVCAAHKNQKCLRKSL